MSIPDSCGPGLRHLTALADPGNTVDWRVALVAESLSTAGVLAALPATLAELAQRCGVDAAAARALLEVLIEPGLVERSGETYLLPSKGPSPVEREAIVQHGVWIRRWAALAGRRLRDRTATALESPARPGPGPGQAMLERASAAAVEPVVDLCGVRPGMRVLDLGGGHGGYARELAARGCSVTLQDLAPVIEAHRQGLLDAGGAELYAQDMFDRLAPGPFDLVLCATVTNMFDPARVCALGEAIRKVLTPGGRLVVVSYLRDRNPVAAVFGVQMLVATEGGDAHSTADYRRWLGDLGYVGLEVHDLTEPPLSVVLAQAPRQVG